MYEAEKDHIINEISCPILEKYRTSLKLFISSLHFCVRLSKDLNLIYLIY